MPTFDRECLLRRVGRDAELDTGSDLPQALSAIREIGERCAAQIGRMPDQVHVIVLSDFKRDTWQAAIDGPLRKILQELQGRHRVDFESVADSPVSMWLLEAEKP
ncbi:MAG: hypothetical protein R3C53_13900 [Pirellulaceae bacterium]